MSKKSPVMKYPFGLMTPPAKLSEAFHGIATAEGRIHVTREAIKAQVGTFYRRFFKKYPKAGLADFARQFDKNVPRKRDGYRVHPTYMALDNMLRAMPEVKGPKKTAEQIARDKATAKRKRAAKRAAQFEKQHRAELLLMRIVQQIGIPTPLLAIAAQKCGYTDAETNALWEMKGSLADVGLGTYVLAVRNGKDAGLPAAAFIARKVVKATADIQAVPTPAELQSAAKSKVDVKPAPSVKDAPAKPKPTYKGKGLYARTLKAGDNLSGEVKPNGHATA